MWDKELYRFHLRNLHKILPKLAPKNVKPFLEGMTDSLTLEAAHVSPLEYVAAIETAKYYDLHEALPFLRKVAEIAADGVVFALERMLVVVDHSNLIAARPVPYYPLEAVNMRAMVDSFAALCYRHVETRIIISDIHATEAFLYHPKDFLVNTFALDNMDSTVCTYPYKVLDYLLTNRIFEPVVLFLQSNSYYVESLGAWETLLKKYLEEAPVGSRVEWLTLKDIPLRLQTKHLNGKSRFIRSAGWHEDIINRLGL